MSRGRAAAGAGLAAVVAAGLAIVLLDGEPRNADPGRPIPQRPVPQGPSARPSPPPRGAERVIRRWLAAIRRSDFERAASYFSVPARVQNGGPPETLDNPALVIAWNAALPCGARLTKLSGAPGGYTVAEFVLTDRAGASCGSGIGAPAASAIKVERGLITEWYRLPDGAPPPGEPVRPDAPELPPTEA